MKKWILAFSLPVRHTFFRVLGICGGLAALNGVMFYSNTLDSGEVLPWILDRAAFFWFFIGGFLLLSLVLCGSMCDRGGHQDNFLARLRVSRKIQFWGHALYHFLCYGLLFGVEGLSLLGLGLWMQRMEPAQFNHQSLMLACYQSDLLHVVFPLSDTLGWVTLGCLLVGLGICTAAMPARNRKGKRSISTFLMVGLTALYVFMQTQSSALFPDGKILALIGTAVFGLISGIAALAEVEGNAE